MLNEEKVGAMTELAIFEKNEGRKIFPINRYFKKDYVGGQMFRSFFGYTFCYLMVLLMWVLYKLEAMLNEMPIEDVMGTVQKWGRTYAVGLVLYLLIAWRVYSKRYDAAARFQVMYVSKLKHLMKRYERDKTEKTRDNRGGRVR